MHGYLGYAPDSSHVLAKSNYFQFALEKSVTQRGLSMISSHQSQNVFIALVSPSGGIHDRACELYQ